MISAFGIEHGDDVAKGAPSYVKGLLRSGVSPYSSKLSAATKGRMLPQYGGNPRFGGSARNTSGERGNLGDIKRTSNASRTGKLAQASAVRGSKAGAALRSGKFDNARSKRTILRAQIARSNTRVLP